MAPGGAWFSFLHSAPGRGPYGPTPTPTSHLNDPPPKIQTVERYGGRWSVVEERGAARAVPVPWRGRVPVQSNRAEQEGRRAPALGARFGSRLVEPPAARLARDARRRKQTTSKQRKIRRRAHSALGILGTSQEEQEQEERAITRAPAC